MKLFSDCSGPCETCAIYIKGTTCLAGHGDDDYVPMTQEEIDRFKKEQNGLV